MNRCADVPQRSDAPQQRSTPLQERQHLRKSHSLCYGDVTVALCQCSTGVGPSLIDKFWSTSARQLTQVLHYLLTRFSITLTFLMLKLKLCCAQSRTQHARASVSREQVFRVRIRLSFLDVRRQHSHRSEPLLRHQSLLHARNYSVL